MSIPISSVSQEQEMQKAPHEDNQDPIRRDSFSEQSLLAPLVHPELETSTGSSTDQKATRQRSLGNSNGQTSRSQQLTSSNPCGTSTSGSRKGHNSHLPKQVFPWMKETRHSSKQNNSLPSSGTLFHLSSGQGQYASE